MIIIFTGVMTMTSEAIWGEAEKQRSERKEYRETRREGNQKMEQN